MYAFVANLSGRCFCWFPAAMLVLIRMDGEIFQSGMKKLRMQKYAILIRVHGGLRWQSNVKLLSKRNWQVVKKRGQPNYSMPAQRRTR